MHDLLLIAGGLALLVGGGEFFVRGAVQIANRLGVSPLLIGLTLVGFGTSTPELVTSVQASLADSPGIAVGNIVGSNIANILVILALSALIAPIAVSSAALRRDGAIGVAVALALAGVGLFGMLDRAVGTIFLLGLVAYIAYDWREERRGEPDHTAAFDKALAKAELMVAKGQSGKRAKFVKAGSKDSHQLDQERIERARRLLGVKGYCTNIPEQELDNASVIARYHDLWRVEKAFRMTKSDLAARPIFHFTEDPIRIHLLICFMALILARAAELRTGLSIRAVVDALWTVTDATLYHPMTNKRVTIRSNIPIQTRTILRKLKVPY